MNNAQFYKKLQEKVPHWKARKWLDDIGAQEILNEAQEDIGTVGVQSHRLSFVLGIMGVILIAAGAISFFAANWQGMSKLLKLSLLFSSMIGAYLASVWALTGSEPRHPALGQAFLLLGVLLFGNNIMLIAQIYHIDSHYPNGILLWAVGALMTAVIMRSESVLIAAILLALLWSGMEIFDFRQIHWPWLIFWIISVTFVIRQQFSLASHIMILSLFCWLLLSFNGFTRYASTGFIVQIYLLIGITVFMLARVLRTGQCCVGFSENLSRYALIFAFIFLYLLSFPELDLYPLLAHSRMDQVTWLSINLLLMVLTVIFLVLRLKWERGVLPLYKWSGMLWLAVLFATLLMNVFLYQDRQGMTVIMVNLLLFTLVIWLIYHGLAEHKTFYVNAAFAIFIITLISRYFDTFWTLLDHSLFFSVGGLVLIVGGYWLEKKRRHLKKRLRESEQSLGTEANE